MVAWKEGPKEVQKEPCANRNEPQAWGWSRGRSKQGPKEVQKEPCAKNRNDPQAWRGRVEGRNRAQKRFKRNPNTQRGAKESKWTPNIGWSRGRSKQNPQEVHKTNQHKPGGWWSNGSMSKKALSRRGQNKTIKRCKKNLALPSPKLTVLPWKVIGTQKERIVSQAPFLRDYVDFSGVYVSFILTPGHSSQGLPMAPCGCISRQPLIVRLGSSNFPWDFFPIKPQFFRVRIGSVWKMMLSDLYCYKYWDVQDVQGER